MFTINTSFYKSLNITRKEQENLRFIPPNLSSLVIVYILYIVPFKEYLNTSYFNLEDPMSPYLLVKDNKPLTTNIISRTLNKESSKLFTKGITLSIYRKIINFIIKTKLNNSSYLSSSPSNSSDLVEDKQANRSTKTSYKHYFNLVTFSNSFKDLSYAYKVKEFSISYFKYFNLLDSLDPLRTTRSSSLLEEPLVSSINNPSSIEDTLSLSNLEDKIKELYRDSTLGFRNLEQREALVNLINNNTPILTFINKTSSGKSLLYLLPSFIFKTRVFIIITPRVSLTTNLVERARTLGLGVSTLDNPLSINTNLYFINIEDLNTRELDSLISTYKTYNRDITIYIDEIHLFLLEANYRLKLKYFNTLLKFKANIVFLSATLSYTLLKILENTLNIKGSNLVIRGSSNREDITYKRIYFRTKQEELSKLKDLLSSIEVDDINLDNKILIFTNSKKQGLELQTLLSLDFIYSNCPNKETILNNFLNSNSSRALITTSILEVSLDLPNIKYTINLEPIFSLLSLV